MDAQRFETLATAYGGDLRRWPEAEREAGLAFKALAPELAQSVLDDAGALDFALDGWRPPAPSMALRDRVLASAPKPRPVRSRFALWLSGAGFAAAALAGVIVGVAASNIAVSDARADAVLAEALPDDAGALLAPFTISGADGTQGA